MSAHQKAERKIKDLYKIKFVCLTECGIFEWYSLNSRDDFDSLIKELSRIRDKRFPKAERRG